VAALTAFAITSNPAYAGPQDDPPTVIVRYDDLNLVNHAGQETLYQRLRTAANTVCVPIDQSQLARKMKGRQCYEQALSAAVIDVNDPGLSALHSGRRGTVTTTVGATARVNPK
jgi:UrcA family protein